MDLTALDNCSFFQDDRLPIVQAKRLAATQKHKGGRWHRDN